MNPYDYIWQVWATLNNKRGLLGTYRTKRQADNVGKAAVQAGSESVTIVKRGGSHGPK